MRAAAHALALPLCGQGLQARKRDAFAMAPAHPTRIHPPPWDARCGRSKLLLTGAMHKLYSSFIMTFKYRMEQTRMKPIDPLQVFAAGDVPPRAAEPRLSPPDSGYGT